MSDSLLDYLDNNPAWDKKDSFIEYHFEGWIRPDKLPTSKIFDFSNAWFEFLRSLTSSGRFGRYKINAGLYKDWKHLERYQMNAITLCKETA